MTLFAIVPSRLGTIQIHRLQNMPGDYSMTCPACHHTYALRPPRHALHVDARGQITVSSPVLCRNRPCGWRASISHGTVFEITDELSTVTAHISAISA